jgi:hypothetical protein
VTRRQKFINVQKGENSLHGQKSECDYPLDQHDSEISIPLFLLGKGKWKKDNF